MLLLLSLLLLVTGVNARISLDTVFVGDPNNNADTTGMGSVGYGYHIETCEVRNTQYVAFLNAKGATNPHEIYNISMTNSSIGGINRSGSQGSYTYTVKSGFENKPVNFVSFWSAARFANWLTNGQGTGDTESGVYNLNGVSIPVNTDITRDAAAWSAGGVAIASEDEWYKAAYFSGQPAPGDWTDQAPSGWTVSNGNEHGKSVLDDLENTQRADEFNGWTFHNIKSWSRNNSNKSIRNNFTNGTGTIAVIDPYEFSLEAGGVTTQSEISTPSIDISGAVAGELKLNFDSSWPRHMPDHACISVSYDGGDPTTMKQFSKINSES